LRLSVIIPARNEADCLGECLRSLAAQQEDIFQLNQDWELFVVDDGSTDETRNIASSFEGVKVLQAQPLPEKWTGKANAIWTAVGQAQGEWLLFTDADTIHEPGNLRRALHEAEHHKVAMLSYSPKQLVSGFWTRAVMPLVFAELAKAFPPEKVSDPKQRLAAANGQFLLAARGPYFAIGGHKAVADRVLEDVELARLFKLRHHPIRFRYGPDAVSAQMYRNLPQMIEGWTKNLALLFANPLMLAAWRALDLLLLVGLPLLAWYLPAPPLWKGVFVLIWLRVWWRYYRSVRKSNFPPGDCLLSVLGLPVFLWLLWNSWFRRHVVREVSWKGRSYNFRGR
jgi:glycosyltransferase involved in cell wall biosynthesis